MPPRKRPAPPKRTGPRRPNANDQAGALRPKTKKVGALPARAPRLMAPAGGRDQFLAALNAGADGIYLGMDRFSARARAENFDLQSLTELLPLAHAYGVEVVVAVNTMLVQGELDEALDLLDALRCVAVDAVVVQDLGLARRARALFPDLKLHASTQMVIHDVAGARQARDLGFSRAVLARELTLTEIERIRAALPPEELQLEAFCLGSTCSSYSGLCLLSSMETGLSGNRGHCVQPCRRTYAIDGPEGRREGSALSTRDLDVGGPTLRALLGLGLDALKIEGRKKDAQYVAAALQRMRQRLDQAWGRSTLRAEAPPLAHSERGEDQDLAFSFQRRGTELYLTSLHPVQPVLDLRGASHVGVMLGRIEELRGGKARLRPSQPLELHDGLRLQGPGAIDAAEAGRGSQFGLRQMWQGAKPIARAEAGQRVDIELPGDQHAQVGDTVYKVRSDELRRRTERLVALPGGERLRAWPPVDAEAEIQVQGEEATLTVALRDLAGDLLTEASASLPAEASQTPRAGGSEGQLREALAVFGEAGFTLRRCSLTTPAELHLPRRQLKELKQTLSDGLRAAWDSAALRRAAARRGPAARWTTDESASSRLPLLHLACGHPQTLHNLLEQLERPESQDSLLPSSLTWIPSLGESPSHGAPDPLSRWLRSPASRGMDLWLGLPPILRSGERAPLHAELERWIERAQPAGFVVANLGSVELLRSWKLLDAFPRLATATSLPVANAAAAEAWAALGAERISLSPELGRDQIAALLAAWPSGGARPQQLLYGQIPLMITESCALAGLEGRCRGPAHCGRATLHLEPLDGESPLGPLQLFHQGCRSFLYAQRPLVLAEHRAELQAMGLRDFGVDLGNLPLGASAVAAALRCATRGEALANGHGGNYLRGLT